MNRGSSQTGFTLAELMIALAIIGILSAIAIPAYREHVRKTYRSQAQANLMSAAQAMERFKSRNNFTYSNAALGAAASPCATAGVPAQSVFTDRSPATGAQMYSLILACTGNTFTLTARPVSGSMMAGDGDMTLTNTGAKNWVDPVIGSKPCWAPKGQSC